MKNNYPVKYAVIGINDEVNKIKQITYIASKCYVIEESIRYSENGEKNKFYNVCFPFTLGNDLFSFIRTNPLNGFRQVDNVYDSYDEAIYAAKLKNEEYVLNKIGILPFDERFQINYNELIKKEEFYIEKYKKLEKLIEENTDDMIVGITPKKQSIVLVTDKDKKEVDLSLYKALELYDDCNVVVYNLLDEEYNGLKEAINYDLPLKVYNNKCLIVYNAKKNIIKINNYDDKDNSYFMLDGCLFVQKDITDKMVHECFNNKPGVIIYTTETYEDVISSYVVENHNYYDNDNKNTPINKKVLFKFKK